MEGSSIARPTRIRGLLHIQLNVIEDTRGWFKENWNQHKFSTVGLEGFKPVQNNISYNLRAGVTRGLHAEPWDKLVSVATGRVFAAWVDLRHGTDFGLTHFAEIGPGETYYVPRGVANGYQALEDEVSYSYLVNGHWGPEEKYVMVNLSDPKIAIPWPLKVTSENVSDKDLAHPSLDQISPIETNTTIVLGKTGQVSRELQRAGVSNTFLARSDLDLASDFKIGSNSFNEAETIIIAAAQTNVDEAEITVEDTWKINAYSVNSIVDYSLEKNKNLVFYSSDYVLHSSSESPISEDEKCYPRGVYAQTKFAGENFVKRNPRHYILRTSWVYGEGKNFIRTMAALAKQGAKPKVVNDQFGRPTSAQELAFFTRHLIETNQPFGTYHFSDSGAFVSWFELAQFIFSELGRDAYDITPISSEDYRNANPMVAERPKNSRLDISKASRTGYKFSDWHQLVAQYLKKTEY